MKAAKKKKARFTTEGTEKACAKGDREFAAFKISARSGGDSQAAERLEEQGPRGLKSAGEDNNKEPLRRS